MPYFNDHIDAGVAGNPKSVERVFVDLPVDGAGFHGVIEAWLVVKKNHLEDDAEAVVLKNITTALTADGQILDTGAVSGKAHLRFELLGEDVSAVVRGFEFEITVLLANGKSNTPNRGTIKAKPRLLRTLS